MGSKERSFLRLIFLDRDGVINVDPGPGLYVTRWGEFQFLPGAIDAIRKLTEEGYEIVIISNQAGVTKGLYTMEVLEEITRNMVREIEKLGGRIRSTHYCPHVDDDNCDCRKPRTGLLKTATQGLTVNFKDTFFIGDGITDIKAGKDIGAKTILVLSGKTSLKDRAQWDVEPDYIAQDLRDAVERIVLKEITKGAKTEWKISLKS
jgi:D-glycero-D-manno-heptose 1,7-bisphosphate phosphatase